MRTKDWKAINTPRILVIGEDSNLQWSETVAKYAMFADYYFRGFPEDHGERSRNVESRNLFNYVMRLTDHQLTPEDVYITNLCNDDVEPAPKGCLGISANILYRTACRLSRCADNASGIKDYRLWHHND